MDVVFFPRNDYPDKVEVCYHRLGKKITFTDDTDTLPQSSYTNILPLLKERNIKGSVFAAYSDFSNTPQIVTENEEGNIWTDIYSQTPAPELLLDPDTATEQNFDAAYYNVWLNAFEQYLGNKPYSISYRTGKYYFSEWIRKYFIGGRGSELTGDTDYGIGCGLVNGLPSQKGYSFDNAEVISNTLRWYDNAMGYYGGSGNVDTELNKVANLIDSTMALTNGGWIRSFVHWHEYVRDNHLEWAERYYDLLAAKNQNNDIYFSGFGEALSYLAYREMITKVVMYSPIHNPNQLAIRLETKNVLGLSRELLGVPISIKFSTIGTPLEGRTITSECNLISLGSGQYIVEIPFNDFPLANIFQSN